MMRMNINGVIGTLTDFPGCAQIVVSHGVFNDPRDRGKGRGMAAQGTRLETIEQLGYDYALCTVEEDNAAQRHILEKHGWVKLAHFPSKRTQHIVCLYGRQITSEYQSIHD